MNEKGNAFNNINKERIIYSKYEMYIYKTQNENRE